MFASVALASTAPRAVSFGYDTKARVWTLSNDVATAQFELTATNYFRLSVFVLASGESWSTGSSRISTPIKFTFDKTSYGAGTQWTLASQSVRCGNDSSCTQAIVLQDAARTVEVLLELSMSTGQAVLRHAVTVKNLKSTSAFVTAADMVPYSFAAPDVKAFRVFRVDQWAIVPQPAAFETHENTVTPNGPGVQLQSGAHGVQCSWVALRDPDDRGIYAGWEFDGLANATVRQTATDLQFASLVADLHHPVEPGKTFRVPPAFIGLYHGDWDEAGYRTQRFVEAALAVPVPDDKFPYVSWDSWAYGQALSENALKTEAWRASLLGIELFIVDLGWAKRLGDWTPDPEKLPNGLKPISDYVHSLGMKFGVHFAFAEADPESDVLRDNPDWTSTESYNYYGGLSLCLSNQPAREWIIAQALRIIEDYGVDWILQDGENMVKRCTKLTHSHDPADSNYSNAVDGLNAVLEAIQQARPNVLWENCENGGNMQTFSMVKRYVTSITNDASGALPSRKAVFGATFPFPPRYADRYQPEEFTSHYVTRSYMFGGPWHLMNRTLTMPMDQFEFARKEIAVYKQIRDTVREGKVFHPGAPPQAGATDTIQSYNPRTDSSVAIICRDGGDSDTSQVQLKGFDPERSYQVTFQDDPRVLTMTGAQLSSEGVLVNLLEQQDGEIVFVRPLAPNLNGRAAVPLRIK